MIMYSHIRDIRIRKGLGVNELSRLCGVNASYISSLETGRKTNPSREVLNKLATALCVPVSELLSDTEFSQYVDVDKDLIKLIRQKTLTLNNKELSIAEKNTLCVALEMAIAYINKNRNKRNE